MCSIKHASWQFFRCKIHFQEKQILTAECLSLFQYSLRLQHGSTISYICLVYSLFYFNQTCFILSPIFISNVRASFASYTCLFCINGLLHTMIYASSAHHVSMVLVVQLDIYSMRYHYQSMLLLFFFVLHIIYFFDSIPHKFHYFSHMFPWFTNCILQPLLSTSFLQFSCILCTDNNMDIVHIFNVCNYGSLFSYMCTNGAGILHQPPLMCDSYCINIFSKPHVPQPP